MADNLNTISLGQPTASDNLTSTYLAESGFTQVITQAVEFVSSVSAAAMSMSGAVNSPSAASFGEITATGANFSSQITSTDAGGDIYSIATAANDTGMADGAVRFVNTASGVSLAYRSGGTTYYIFGSTVSEA